MITLSRKEAGRKYGPSFMKHIMKDSEEISVTVAQDAELSEYYAMQIGAIVPFLYPVVYVVEAKSGMCKIGHTWDIKRRVLSFDGSVPGSVNLRHIEILAKGPATKCEFAAHKKLAGARENGEWFSVAPDVAILSVKDAAAETCGSIDLMAAWDISERRERKYRLAKNGDPHAVRKMTDARESMRWAIERICTDMG